MDDLSDAAFVSEFAFSDSALAAFAAAAPTVEALAPERAGPDTPWLRELSAELGHCARQALDGPIARATEQVQDAADRVHQKNLWASEEAFRKWKEKFEAAQNAAREQGFAQHNDVLGRVKCELDQDLDQAKHLIEEIEQNRTALGALNDAAADAQLKFGALEAARIAQLLSSQTMPDFSEESIDKAAQWAEHDGRARLQALLKQTLGAAKHRLTGELEAESSAHANNNESNAVLLCSEQEADQKAWREDLDRLSDEVVARCRERFETTVDSWIVSSVHRLNQQGQSAIDSLARSSDQALRRSCARFFDDLAKLLLGNEAEGQRASASGRTSSS